MKIRSKSDRIDISLNKQHFQSQGIVQGQQIKLNQLRRKRKELQQKFKLINNRVGYRRKKEEDQFRKMLKSQDQLRSMSQTYNFKKLHQILKDENLHKQQFEINKKAMEVQFLRNTNNKRLSFIYQAVKQRKCSQSEKLKIQKKISEQHLNRSRQEALNEKQQKRDQVQQMRQRQQFRRKGYWMQKKIQFENKLNIEAELYQKQIKDYYRKIQKLKEAQNELLLTEKQAEEGLMSVKRNLELLRQG